LVVKLSGVWLLPSGESCSEVREAAMARNRGGSEWQIQRRRREEGDEEASRERKRTLPSSSTVNRPNPSSILPLLLLIRDLRLEAADVEPVDLDERARFGEVPPEETEGGTGEHGRSEDGGPAKERKG
jgi:hypothetical protein